MPTLPVFPFAKTFFYPYNIQLPGWIVEKTDNWMVMLGMGILLISLVGSALGGRPDDGVPPPPDGWGSFHLMTEQRTDTGTGQESSEKEHGMSVCVTNLVSFSVTLTWQDEAANRPFLTNQPDELGLTVASPAGESKSDKKTASQGSVKLEFTFPVTDKTAATKTSKAGFGPWAISVEIGICGDQTPIIPDPGGRRTVADTGNAYTLEISYTYYMKSSGGM